MFNFFGGECDLSLEHLKADEQTEVLVEMVCFGPPILSYVC